MYNGSKKMLFFLLGISCVATIVSLLEVGRHTKHPLIFAASPKDSLDFPNVTRPIHDYTGCFIHFLPSDFVTWIPPLVFEMLLCLVMLYKAFKLNCANIRDPLINLIIRDRFVQ